MGRLNYSDDEEFSGQFALWTANVNRSLLGKKGQVALSRLRAALLALPEKRLIEGTLVKPDGDVCTLGVVLLYDAKRAGTYEAVFKELVEVDEDEESVDFAPKDFPRLVAWQIVAENDISLEGVTPEIRYSKMLAWVEARLAGNGLEL